jgi:pimeloyl-ACP methyl ester carboxylesterase
VDEEKKPMHSQVDEAFHPLEDSAAILAEMRGSGWKRWSRPWRQVMNLQGATFDRLLVGTLERFFVSGTPVEVDGALRQRIDRGAAIYASDELLADRNLYFRPPAPPEGVRVKKGQSLKKGGVYHVSFPSGYRTHDPQYQSVYDTYRRNEINRVQLWQHDDPQRPTVICAHSWCGGILAVEARIFAASRLYANGWNVALYTMPFHGARTPRQARFSGQLFPSANVGLTNEAFGQAVADLRMLMTWLREERQSGPIGMMGISLGGYTTALMASLEPSLAFAVPIVAPASFADVVWKHGEGNPRRKATEAHGMTLADFRRLWSIHCPLTMKPVIPLDRRLLVWGEGDRIVFPEHQAALWEHWNRPEMIAFTGGHLMQWGWLQYTRAIHRWIAALLGDNPSLS